ncbi:MAG: hypothetical protein JSU69_03240 [Candidatus Zixiibacteriota bacterium]|nr:MAG: hypothetical protein JSU69_03240 [candidate division Zixibacteria bacterium]
MKSKTRNFSISILVSLAVLVAGDGIGTAELPEFLCGDTDGSGVINILDASFVVNYLYRNGPAPDPLLKADVNGSGEINLLDVTATIDYLYRNGPEPDCPTLAIPPYQNYIFDVWYTNYAWGYRLEGKYIDKQGWIHSYNHGDEEWDSSSAGGWTEEELTEKYSHNNVLVGMVHPDTLLAKFNLIDEAAEGPMSPPEVRCFDAGLVQWMAYMYDTTTSRYIPIVLHMAGDYAQANFSPAAEELYQWLRALTDDTGETFCDY